MNFAEKLFNLLAAARMSAPNKVLTKARWLEVAQDLFAREAQQFVGALPKVKRKATPISRMTDDEFLTYLQNQEPYAGIDIPREIGKCRVWCETRGKKPTRMRVINWLNKADRTLTNHGRSPERRARDVEDRTKRPPDGWETFMKEKQAEWSAANGGAEAPGTFALSVGDFFGMPESWRAECFRKLGGAT